MKLDIEQVVNLSTAHVTEQDNDHLTECSKSDPSHPKYRAAGWVVATDYGFMVFMPPKDNKEEVADHIHAYKEIGLSKEFLDLCKLAAERDCTWLRFDCDIPETKGLPTFGW
jgi:hypothetical protein